MHEYCLLEIGQRRRRLAVCSRSFLFERGPRKRTNEQKETKSNTNGGLDTARSRHCSQEMLETDVDSSTQGRYLRCEHQR